MSKLKSFLFAGLLCGVYSVQAMDTCDHHLKSSTDWTTAWNEHGQMTQMSPELEAISNQLTGLSQYQPIEQREILWNLMLQTQYEPGRLPQFNLKNDVWIKIKSLLGGRKVFENNGARLIQPGSVKVLHPIGASAMFRFTPVEENQVTGVFSQPAYGIVRFSPGLPLEDNYIPGVAFTFFIYQNNPVNIHLMPSLEGQGLNRNPFEKAVSNHLPPLNGVGLKIAAQVLRLISLGRDPLKVPVKELFYIESDGRKHTEQVFSPEKVVLVPTLISRSLIDAASTKDPRENLAEIPPGTPIYDLYVEGEGFSPLLLGTISLDSTIISSFVGDMLRFPHQDSL